MQLRALLLLPVVIQIAQSCDCGQTQGPKIIDGTQVKDGTYPWMANLVEKNDKKSSYCGAAIVAQKYALTASHCIRGRNKNDFVLLVGGYDFNNLDTGHLFMDIAEFILYKSEKEGGNDLFEADLAVVKLKKSLDYTPRIQPICLPSKGDQFVGDKATAVGYGSTNGSVPDPRSASKVPLSVDLNVTTLDQCLKDNGNKFDAKVLCAAAIVQGQGICQGDSGGPLMYYNPTQTKWELIGVSSASAGVCGDGHFDLFVNVAYFIDWIQKQIKNTGCQI